MKHKERKRGQRQPAPPEEQKTASFGIPLSAATFALLGFIAAYVGARAVTDVHPVHWTAAFIGAIVGYGVGYLWYRVRGDFGSDLV